MAAELEFDQINFWSRSVCLTRVSHKLRQSYNIQYIGNYKYCMYVNLPLYIRNKFTMSE